jgi:hypothetical protein
MMDISRVTHRKWITSHADAALLQAGTQYNVRRSRDEKEALSNYPAFGVLVTFYEQSFLLERTVPFPNDGKCRCPVGDSAERAAGFSHFSRKIPGAGFIREY